MDEELLDQVRWQLTDTADNLEVPECYEGCLAQYRREWLFAVADIATEMGKAIVLKAPAS